MANPSQRGNPGQPKANAILGRARKRGAASEAMPLVLGRKPFREGAEIDMDEGGVDVTNRLGLMDVGAHDCKWISGDPLLADHSFCGKPVKPGTSWCPEHHKRVYSGASN